MLNKDELKGFFLVNSWGESLDDAFKNSKLRVLDEILENESSSDSGILF